LVRSYYGIYYNIDAGDTGGENTGLLSSGMIVVNEDQSNIYDKFSPKVNITFINII